MAGTRGKPMFKLFEPMSPPPGWKCPKRFKLGLGEPWESEGSSDSDTDIGKVAMHSEETTQISKNVTIRTNCNDITERKRQEKNWNSKASLDETDELLLLASQNFEATQRKTTEIRKNSEEENDKTGTERQTLLDETDTLLLLASQKFEAEYNASSTGDKDKADDEVLLYLLEPFVRSNDAKMMLTHNEELCDKSGEEASREAVNVRYRSPKTKEKVVKARKGGIPQKTQDQNKWIAN